MIAARQILIGVPVLRIEANSFAGVGHRLFVLSHRFKHERQVVSRNGVPRISLFPLLIDLNAFFQLLPGGIVVVRRNIELLPFACPLSQIKCPLNIAHCVAGLALIAVGDSKRSQRHCKIGVKFDGALQMRDRGHVVKLLVFRLPQAESL